MKNQMSFEQKVRSFTAKEMVETMIKGIENEWVKVNMGTFGVSRNGICYGCAATNAVCEIMQKSFIGEEVTRISSRAETIKADSKFLYHFELAIDSLRSGDIVFYNIFAKALGMTLLPKPEDQLPCLITENYKENLKVYKEYASSLPNEKLID